MEMNLQLRKGFITN